MDHVTEEAIEKLKEDKSFQNAIKKYEEAEKLSQEYAANISKNLVDILKLQDTQQTIEQSRFNLVVAKMTGAKLMAMLSSFSYTEHDFMDALVKARKCIQDELVPMLMNVEPCGECEQCKNGHPERCIRPHVRDDYCESRFLPLLSDALIEYDAWTEILYNNIPASLRDEDVLQDVNDEFQNEVKKLEPKKRKGRPPKIEKKED